MNSGTVAAVCILAVAIYFFVFSFSKTFAFVLRFLLRAGLGMCALSAFNLLAAAYGISIGLNAYTFGLCGMLGLPGYILLLGIKLIC